MQGFCFSTREAQTSNTINKLQSMNYFFFYYHKSKFFNSSYFILILAGEIKLGIWFLLVKND